MYEAASRYRRMESGETMPRLATLVRLANALGVDASTFFRTSLESNLQTKIAEGNIFEQAGSVAEGLLLIPQFHPDVLLLDLNMKDSTGIDLLFQLEAFDFDMICMSSLIHVTLWLNGCSRPTSVF